MSLDLHAGDMRLGLVPETGGAVASFTFRGIPLLRPVSDPRLAAQHGRAVAAYPLIPYANRIANGRFSLDGRSFELARNFGDHPNSIHGNAWMRPWSVSDHSDTQAHLTFDHRPPEDPASEWPFAYDAKQIFTLSADRLVIALTARNADTRPFPAGIGIHPYVARTPLSTLRFEADTVWLNGSNSLPADRIAIPESLEFDQPRQIGIDEIDNCFAGWGGSASLRIPEHGITLHIEAGPPLDHFQVYTPADQDFCGLEPVSNMPDGINRMDAVADQGMVMLAPGAELGGTVTLRVSI